VTEAHSNQRIFRFGVFELHSSTGELRKDGCTEPRLGDQSLQVLLSLLERPCELVTREELRERFWSSDTVVDFDRGLNIAVNRLRNALDDSAANPRFIQTLPRRGYRFVAPLEVVATEGARPAAMADGNTLVLVGGRPPASKATARILFVLIQLMYLSFYALSLARLAAVETVLAASGNAARLLSIAIMMSAAAGIPVRLYLLSGAAFQYKGLRANFLKLFPLILPLDELWTLASFRIVGEMGVGLAIATTAALLYLPFAQRRLLLIGSSAAPK
jgi:cholera toxin transcriptional activator